MPPSLLNNSSNTVHGRRKLMGSITCPPELIREGICDHSWTSAVIAMAACQSHKDGDFLNSDRGFHPLTVTHYSSGICALSSLKDRIAHSRSRNEHLNDIRELIFDLATVLDRLSGGSTIVLHHPGATPPYADVVSEDISVRAYLNPRNLADHPELHKVGARLVQTFAEEWALPVARSFRDYRARHHWRQETPAPRRHRDFATLPLIPYPLHPMSCSFVFPGRPVEQLANLLTSDAATSFVPRTNRGSFEWTRLSLREILPPVVPVREHWEPPPNLPLPDIDELVERFQNMNIGDEHDERAGNAH